MLMLRDRWKKPDENRENQDPYREYEFHRFPTSDFAPSALTFSLFTLHRAGSILPP